LQCGSGLNLQAMCGAGIDALLVAVAGVTRMGANLYASCNIGLKLQAVQNLLKIVNPGGEGLNFDEFNEEETAALMNSRRLGESSAAETSGPDLIAAMKEMRDAIWAKKGFNMSYSEARRLAGMEEDIFDKIGDPKNIKEPKDLWMKMGHNVTDPNSAAAKNFAKMWELQENDNDPISKEAFVRVMQPFMKDIGEAEDEDIKNGDKWPLMPSHLEQEEDL